MPRSGTAGGGASCSTADAGAPLASLVGKRFGETLRALAAEYDRVSAENTSLRQECQRLQGLSRVPVPAFREDSRKSDTAAEDSGDNAATAARVRFEDKPAARLPPSQPQSETEEQQRQEQPRAYTIGGLRLPFSGRSNSVERRRLSDSEAENSSDAERTRAVEARRSTTSQISTKSARISKDEHHDISWSHADCGVWKQTGAPWMNSRPSTKMWTPGSTPKSANSNSTTVGNADSVPNTPPPFKPQYRKTASVDCFSLDSRVAKKFQMSDIVGIGKYIRRATTRNRMRIDDALRTANVRRVGNRCVVNPERSKCLYYWDQITIVALAFVAVVAPVQVAMMETKMDALFIINGIIDFVFIVDMILQFFLMYPVKTNYGTAWEHRHSRIVMNYLQGWFVIDLASIVPFDLISLLSSSERMQKAKAVKVIRLLRLLKLARMCKATRLFRRLEMRMAIAYQRLALAKFLSMLFLVTHWMANLWALTLILVEEDDGLPRWVDSFTQVEASYGDTLTKDNPWKIYITCLYFTSYTITSVGYGDIGPANIWERIVCTLMIFVSGITWALLIAQVCSIVSSMDSEEQAFRKIMDDLNVMMQDRELPVSMRRRLRSFFLSNKSSARHERHRKIVETMSPALRGEVCLEMNRMWISKVSFFNSFLQQTENDSDEHLKMQNFMVNVSRALSGEVFAQGEPFGHPQVLYILNRGLASHTGKVRRSGSVWGTDFVLSNKDLLEPYGSFALTYVEVTNLTRVKFMKVLEMHKKECPQIASIVRRYCGWLALQRTILLEAQRRRRSSSAGSKGLPFQKSGNI